MPPDKRRQLASAWLTNHPRGKLATGPVCTVMMSFLSLFIIGSVEFNAAVATPRVEEPRFSASETAPRAPVSGRIVVAIDKGGVVGGVLHPEAGRNLALHQSKGLLRYRKRTHGGGVGEKAAPDRLTRGSREGGRDGRTLAPCVRQHIANTASLALVAAIRPSILVPTWREAASFAAMAARISSQMATAGCLLRSSTNL